MLALMTLESFKNVNIGKSVRQSLTHLILYFSWLHFKIIKYQLFDYVQNLSKHKKVMNFD